MIRTQQSFISIVRILLASICAVVLLLPSIAFAQTGQAGGTTAFQPLVENVPQIGTATNLNELLNGLFILTIGGGAILAVVMIAFGGIQYMGSDSFSTKSAAKERMLNALIGLALILMSVLILGTINPAILTLNPFATAPKINVEPNSAPPAQTNPTTTTPPNPQSGANIFGPPAGTPINNIPPINTGGPAA